MAGQGTKSSNDNTGNGPDQATAASWWNATNNTIIKFAVLVGAVGTICAFLVGAAHLIIFRSEFDAKAGLEKTLMDSQKCKIEKLYKLESETESYLEKLKSSIVTNSVNIATQSSLGQVMSPNDIIMPFELNMQEYSKNRRGLLADAGDCH